MPLIKEVFRTTLIKEVFGKPLIKEAFSKPLIKEVFRTIHIQRFTDELRCGYHHWWK